jgi:hypothetical protein
VLPLNGLIRLSANVTHASYQIHKFAQNNRQCFLMNFIKHSIMVEHFINVLIWQVMLEFQVQQTLGEMVQWRLSITASSSCREPGSKLYRNLNTQKISIMKTFMTC